MASPASRRELIRLLTLNEISDDYENLTVSIAGPVTRVGKDCGLTIEKSEIVEALKELVELGWATAYLPNPHELVEIEGMPPLDNLEGQDGAWFYITEAGRKFQNEYDGYPFDEQGEMRKDWTPPAN
jgi:hypothetical protein